MAAIKFQGPAADGWRASLILQAEGLTGPACRMCEEIGSGFGPSHDGSPRCQSGSLASGGTHAHCTCDTCF